MTHKVTIGHWELFFTVGLYPDGKPGELFIGNLRGPEVTVGIKGVLNQWAIAVSMLLQAGFTVEDLAKKFGHARYEPAGFTSNHNIPNALSLTDYIMRWILAEFGIDKQKGQTT